MGGMLNKFLKVTHCFGFIKRFRILILIKNVGNSILPSIALKS